MSMNKAFFSGRLGADPTLKYTSGGKAVCNFRMACKMGFAKKGEEPPTTWVNFQAWEGAAETIAEYAEKGQQLHVWARYEVQSWEDDDGGKHERHFFTVEEFEFGSKPGAGGPRKRDDDEEERPRRKSNGGNSRSKPPATEKKRRPEKETTKRRRSEPDDEAEEFEEDDDFHDPFENE